MNEEMLGMEELTTPKNIRAYIAEFIGTMLFVLIGTGAVIVVGGQDIVAIALAHGIAYAAMVYATMKISGGHINPAVTLAMMVTGRMKIAPGGVYMAAQVLGGIMATLLLYVILRNEIGNLTEFGAHGIGKEAVAGDGGALLLELILTAVLIIVIYAVAVAKDGYGIMAPLAIGLTIVAIHLIAFPLTGASVNPARWFGPALISNAFDSLWVYIIGPALGATIGALLYHYVFLQPVEEESSGG